MTCCTQATVRSNTSKLSAAREAATTAQQEAAAERSAAQLLRQQNAELCERNGALSARIAVLEATLQFASPDCRQSLCQHVVKELAVMRNVGLY